MASTLPANFPFLGDDNYARWKTSVCAHLMQNDCWMIVNGDWTCLISDDKEIRTWRRLQERAAGILWNSITQSQQIHVQDVMSDPICMWSVLASIQEQKCPEACFVAYDNLFGACKEDNESLPALVTRVKGLHHVITNS